jgi:hypothetical protein
MWWLRVSALGCATNPLGLLRSQIRNRQGARVTEAARTLHSPLRTPTR